MKSNDGDQFNRGNLLEENPMFVKNIDDEP